MIHTLKMSYILKCFRKQPPIFDNNIQGVKPTLYEAVKKTTDFYEKGPFKLVCNFYYYFQCLMKKNKLSECTKVESTVKPVLVVTSIKQPTCIKQPEESCLKIHTL